MSIRVLLVDDQALVRTGFRMILADEEGIEVVGEAANGREAVDGAPRLRPDVVVMDIRMPIMDGVEATRRLTASAGEAPRVLVLTTFDTDEHVVEALRAGASGFLLKDVTPADFVAAIRVVASGEALIAPSVTRRLLERFVQASPSADAGRDRQVGQLTEREREVLELVAQGLSNREIADRLVLAEPTVKTHVSHLLLKLDLRDRAQLVVLAYESGIVRPGSRPRPDAPSDRRLGRLDHLEPVAPGGGRRRYSRGGLSRSPARAPASCDQAMSPSASASWPGAGICAPIGSGADASGLRRAVRRSSMPWRSPKPATRALSGPATEWSTYGLRA